MLSPDTKDDTWYEVKLARLEALMDLDAKPDTPEGRELEALSTLIELYEKKHYPVERPSEEVMAQFRKEQEGK